MGTREGISMNPIWFLIFAFLCIWGLHSSLVGGANTIGIGDELNSSSTLVSPNHDFTLEFFTLSDTNYGYFGIRDPFVIDDPPRRVWVGNPNTPLLNNSGVLTIDSTGILKITSGGRTIVNISDQVVTGRNVTATLHDSGNFILMDETDGQILWQSFDHPSNSLFPGMKLGQNLRTGQNWSLTSWISGAVAASGAFTLRWEPEPTQESGQLVIYRREVVYWKSGLLRSQSIDFMPDVVNNLRYVSNNDEMSFNIYSDDGNLRRWLLTRNGQIFQDFHGSEYYRGRLITSHNFCYGFESDNGCAESGVAQPECRDRNDRFEESVGYFNRGIGSRSIDRNSSLSLSDCMERCWNNCTCLGFTSYANGTGCVFWNGRMNFEIAETGNSSSIYLLLPFKGAGTIGLGDELNSSDHLVSQGRNFTLGFFNSNTSDFSSYLGIWYTNDDQARKVWVANPNTPILNNSGVLTLDSTGVLKITSGESTIVNISDQVRTGNVSATLDDSGNFVLLDEAERQTIWQSFDHPTNTLLPGMKLGFNLTTGQNWSLTSWVSDSVPAFGAFTLSWEPTPESGELVIRRRGDLYWTSGDLKNQTFEFMPFLNSSYHLNFSYVSNNDGNYFTFSDVDGSLLMWVLSENGQILDGNQTKLTPFEFCYGYETNDGCANSVVPDCRGRNDKFEPKRAYFVGNSSSFDDSSSLSDCMEMCWNNCTCVGFINSSNGTGCTIWSGSLEYREDNPDSMIIYVLVRGNSSQGNRWWIWLIITVSISLPMLFLGFFCYFRIKKSRREGEEKKLLNELTASDSFDNVKEIGNEGREGHHDLKLFSFASIVAATNDFSNENKLGQGGFGPVYKGRLSEGKEIAIKRLSKTSRQGLVEFKNELILITKLQHTNLVRVLGCCIHGEEMMLIYEYMPNKSLDFFLFDPTKSELLDWKKRWNIIEGVAQGLLYLHKYSRMKVIHRDLKASNVLLDENMNPKISDFGMARIFKQNETEAITKRVVGTYGYMSPEYAMEGTFSVKSDVFSFGVLILEIVSGRKNTGSYHLDRPLNLVGYAWELWREGIATELKDPTLGDSCVDQQLLRIIHVSFLCVQESAIDRPTMSDVISMLGNETIPLPAPKQPAFFTGRNAPQSTLAQTESKPHSVNELTISVMEAR